MIRTEQRSEFESVRAIHNAAFPTTAEADLVDTLRTNDNLLVSLVVSEDSQLVGHVAFSPVSIADSTLVGAGLAPVAVLPSHQGRGYGGRLIQAGLDTCRNAGIDYVVVLGDPDYYKRFGFATATASGLENEYGAGGEFMVVELTEQCLSNTSGLVRYGEEFRVLS